MTKASFRKSASPKLKPIFYIWLGLALMMLLINFLPNDLINGFDKSSNNSSTNKPLSSQELKHFNKSISDQIKSIDQLAAYIEEQTKDSTNKEAAQIELLTKIIRQRFIHAYGIYGLRENWIAVLSGKLIWKDLCAKVIPDDILKDRAAACSQVSIVIMSALRQMNIHSRHVELNGHYTLEAYFNQEWYYIDADIKPDFGPINGRKSLAAILSKGEQYTIYKNTGIDSARITQMFSEVSYGQPNEYPAPKAYIFQYITKIISHWGWLIPLAFAIKILVLYRRQT